MPESCAGEGSSTWTLVDSKHSCARSRPGLPAVVCWRCWRRSRPLADCSAVFLSTRRKAGDGANGGRSVTSMARAGGARTANAKRPARVVKPAATLPVFASPARPMRPAAAAERAQPAPGRNSARVRTVFACRTAPGSAVASLMAVAENARIARRTAPVSATARAPFPALVATPIARQPDALRPDASGRARVMCVASAATGPSVPEVTTRSAPWGKRAAVRSARLCAEYAALCRHAGHVPSESLRWRSDHGAP
jgi:hypothetical protein